MKRLTAAVALALALPAQGRQIAGVEFPEAISVGGAEVRLNGAGIRKKLFIKVYAAGLYLARPSPDGAAIVAADAPKMVRMVFLRGVDRKKILETYREGFEKNSAGPGLPDLLAKLEQIAPALADMRAGSEMRVSYAPGSGTTVSVTGGGSVTIAGKEFSDAMFRNWLGRNPADADLAAAFLGR